MNSCVRYGGMGTQSEDESLYGFNSVVQMSISIPSTLQPPFPTPGIIQLCICRNVLNNLLNYSTQGCDLTQVTIPHLTVDEQHAQPQHFDLHLLRF